VWPGFAGIRAPIPYRHDADCFNIAKYKWLSAYDVEKGLLVSLTIKLVSDVEIIIYIFCC